MRTFLIYVLIATVIVSWVLLGVALVKRFFIFTKQWGSLKADAMSTFWYMINETVLPPSDNLAVEYTRILTKTGKVKEMNITVNGTKIGVNLTVMRVSSYLYFGTARAEDYRSLHSDYYCGAAFYDSGTGVRTGGFTIWWLSPSNRTSMSVNNETVYFSSPTVAQVKFTLAECWEAPEIEDLPAP